MVAERGLPHVELLPAVGDVVQVAGHAVDSEVEVEAVYIVEETGDGGVRVTIVGAIENHCTRVEWGGRRCDAEHAIGHRSTVVVGGVDGYGTYRPGVLGSGVQADEGEEKKSEMFHESTIKSQ